MSMIGRRTLLGGFAGAAALTAAPALGTRGAAAQAATVDEEDLAAYAMAYFTESPDMLAADYGLHLAVSQDGLVWTPLNDNAAVATPTAGSTGLRDPFVLRKQDGTFVVLATDLKGTDWAYQSQYLHVWDSDDLRSFTGYRRMKVHSLASHAWAPEAYWDASRGAYAVVYSTVPDGHNMLMVNYTTDFVTASDPQVFYDPGYDAIDGSFATADGVTYMYYKNNTNSTLLGTRSTTAQPGSFEIFTSAFGPGRGVEAPQITKSNTDDVWYLWGDTWSPNGRFFAWSTTDLSTGTWTALDDATYRHPLNAKHLGIVRLTGHEAERLERTWGTPAWRRLKSYNYPGRFVRHQNFVARIDTYPFDPYQDQLWTPETGLAGSGTTYRSVNYPGRVLTVVDQALVVAADDGTSAFAAASTFHVEPGLADAEWQTLRWHADASKVVRHANYVLRVDAVGASSTATAKADATFQIGY